MNSYFGLFKYFGAAFSMQAHKLVLPRGVDDMGAQNRGDT